MAVRLLPPLLALSLLAASAAGAGELVIDFPGSQVEEATVSYRCGSVEMDVRYVNAGPTSLAIFDWNGDRIVAAAGISASGVRYVSGRYVWWSKGGEATLYDEMAGENAALLATCAERR
ncbi:MAG: MliC family protein [Rhizobiaceae bacterium]|nr:MliC family protein [Rhizobiaceae bacterium]